MKMLRGIVFSLSLVLSGFASPVYSGAQGGLLTATYVSGGSFSGTGNCTLASFNNGLSGQTVTIAVSSGTPGSITITTPGSGATSAPTSATASSGTATCSGTVTLTSTISGYVDTTFTGATKQNIIDNVETQLLNAGWSTVSGHGTTNLLMQSAMAQSAYQINVRLKDNSGSCVQVYIESTDASLKAGAYDTSHGGSLLPATAKTFRIIASRYQVLVYTTTMSNNREFVWVGIPYIPSFLSSTITTKVGFMFSDSNSDSDTGLHQHPRQVPCLTGCGGGTNSSSGNYELMANSSFWECTNNTSCQPGNGNAVGAPRAIFMCTSAWAETFSPSIPGRRYRNNAFIGSDVLMAWGSTGLTDEAMVVGQAYDIQYISDAVTIDQTAVFDTSHTYRNFTNTNSGSQNNFPPGGFWVATN